MAETRRVNIGFEGGQALAVRLSEEALKGLREALGAHAGEARGSEGGWHDLAAEDGSALVYVPKILYVTTDSSEHRVGFGI